MYWFEAERVVINGAKIRRRAWKILDRYIWYSNADKRLYDHQSHRDKPWNAQNNDLTEASDWVLF